MTVDPETMGPIRPVDLLSSICLQLGVFEDHLRDTLASRRPHVPLLQLIDETGQNISHLLQLLEVARALHVQSAENILRNRQMRQSTAEEVANMGGPF